MSDILPTKSEWAKRIRACWQQSVHSILETRWLTGQRLPNRRGHELLNFEHDGIGYTAGVGGFADGGVAEISLNTAKHGTPLDVNARDAAVAASLLLQHGCQVDTLRRAHSDGSASGPLAKALNLLAEK
jgi:hypothetical protein